MRVLHLEVVDEKSVIIGRILAVQNTSKKFLPNGHDFAMVYGDFTGVDESGTGTFKLFDMNWDNYQAATITLREGLIAEWESSGIPTTIREKYERIDEGTHYCDYNGNGDISFGECYACMTGACNSNPECKALCDFADRMGGLKGQCMISKVVTCAIIAIYY